VATIPHVAPGKNGGDSGSDGITLDDAGVTDEHAFHVGDGVEGTRLEGPDLDAEIADPLALLARSENGGEENEDGESGLHPSSGNLTPACAVMRP
jgi:hypothetical protein